MLSNLSRITHVFEGKLQTKNCHFARIFGKKMCFLCLWLRTRSKMHNFNTWNAALKKIKQCKKIFVSHIQRLALHQPKVLPRVYKSTFVSASPSADASLKVKIGILIKSNMKNNPVLHARCCCCKKTLKSPTSLINMYRWSLYYNQRWRKWRILTPVTVPVIYYWFIHVFVRLFDWFGHNILTFS